MSNLDRLKASILVYIDHFTTYDYIAYAWLAFLFFITILLSILMAKKSPIFSILIFMISLMLLLIGPFVLKHYLNEHLRPSFSTLIETKKLNFSDTLIVTGSVKNISKNSFSICKIDVAVLKSSDNSIENLLSRLKPLRKKTIVIDEVIETNRTKEFKAIFDGYRFLEDVNISLKSECY